MGMGYVGLTLATAMADRGFEVDGIEVNPTILGKLNQGGAHFYELGLDVMLRRGMRSGNLRFSGKIPQKEAHDLYIITVGTPLDARHEPRLDMVENVAREIAANMRDGAMVILRSTVRIGTTRKIVKPILEATGKSFNLSFCPERTIEGKALEELFQLPQIVGTDERATVIRAANIFHRLTSSVVPVTSYESGELIKLLDNSYRDLFFAFGNEVALMAESLGIDGREVISAANQFYVRTNIALPGFVGGPCLEKDPHILVHSMKDYNFIPRLVQLGRRTNEELVTQVFHKLDGWLVNRHNPTISLLGLAFKGQPDTSDLRGSIALNFIEMIRNTYPKARIKGHDHIVPREDIERLGIECVSEDEAFRNTDVAMILNNNRRYSSLDIEAMATLMNRPGLIYDVWNIFTPSIVLPAGIKYHALGKK